MVLCKRRAALLTSCAIFSAMLGLVAAPPSARAQFVCGGSATGAELQTGDGATATKAGAVACGTKAAASGSNSTAIGDASAASGNNSTAVGDSSKASGNSTSAYGSNSTASNIGSTAIGANAVSSGSNSVALGAGSTDGGVANVVSVGAVGAERRIVNVAAGIAATDAV